MQDMLKQLGGLLLGSIPTIILLCLLTGLYNLLVHKPLLKVLAERRSKTEGAIEKSQADIAAAAARTNEFELRLREARATLFRAQEARRKAALDLREKAVSAARAQSQAQVEAARQDLDKDKQAAKITLQGQASSLAAEIAQRVLAPAGAGR